MDCCPASRSASRRSSRGFFRVLNDGVRDLTPEEAEDVVAGYDGGIWLRGSEDGLVRLGSDGSRPWPLGSPEDHVFEVAPDGTMWAIPRALPLGAKALASVRPTARCGRPSHAPGTAWGSRSRPAARSGRRGRTRTVRGGSALSDRRAGRHSTETAWSSAASSSPTPGTSTGTSATTSAGSRATRTVSGRMTSSSTLSISSMSDRTARSGGTRGLAGGPRTCDAVRPGRSGPVRGR